MLRVASLANGGFEIQIGFIEVDHASGASIKLVFDYANQNPRLITCDATIEAGRAQIKIQKLGVFGHYLAAFCDSLQQMHISSVGSAAIEFCDSEFRIVVTVIDSQRAIFGAQGGFEVQLLGRRNHDLEVISELKGVWGTIILDQSSIPSFINRLREEIAMVRLDTTHPMI